MSLSASILLTQGFRNLLQTAVILLAMALLLGVVGWGLAGPHGLALMTGSGVGFMLFGTDVSGRVVMRALGAHPLTPQSAPIPFRILTAIARRANLSATPALYLLASSTPQAFTIGNRSDSAAICLSEGLLRVLGPRELAGVLAHEIAHILNRDIYVMMLADLVTRLTRGISMVGILLIVFNASLYVAGTEGGLPWWLPMVMLLAPTISALMQLALSRTREFEADRVAAHLSQDPEGLARALMALDLRNNGFWDQLLRSRRDGIEPSILRTHPLMEERVERLHALAREQPLGDFEHDSGPVLQGPHTTTNRRPHWGLWWWR
jgi:heat shock protein HtpX